MEYCHAVHGVEFCRSVDPPLLLHVLSEGIAIKIKPAQHPLLIRASEKTNVIMRERKVYVHQILLRERHHPPTKTGLTLYMNNIYYIYIYNNNNN